MIPKILHYIWLGEEKPNIVKHCIKSFYKYCSDFKIIEWNESNIDTSIYDPLLKYTYNKFYRHKEYAFCSDVARLYILKQYGGIYVDTDVEFIKHIPDDFLKTSFISKMANNHLTVGAIWGAKQNDEVVNELINIFIQKLDSGYRYKSQFIFDVLVNNYFKNIASNINIFNNDTIRIKNYTLYNCIYFSPIYSRLNINHICDKTISIHYYSNLWKNKYPANLDGYLKYKDDVNKNKE